LETLKASPRINRKEFAKKFIGPDTDVAEAEKTKLALAADLHWMIREGHVIEFNDGSLDLPRAKPPKKEPGEVSTDLPPVTAAATTEPVATLTDALTTEQSVVAAAVTGGRTDASTVIPSREDNASPARTEGPRERPDALDHL
jgi:hypothetical protein